MKKAHELLDLSNAAKEEESVKRHIEQAESIFSDMEKAASKGLTAHAIKDCKLPELVVEILESYGYRVYDAQLPQISGARYQATVISWNDKDII